MPRYVLPLTTVTDGYQYFSCPNTKFVTVQGFGNAIDIGYGEGPGVSTGSGMYPPADEYIALQTATLPRNCDEIRFKNHTPGKPAQIQITAQGSGDIPSDIPLSVGISSNLLTINADGSVAANFPGGVTIPAGLNFGTSTSQNQVQWIRQSDGAVVAQIAGWDDGSGNEGLTVAARATQQANASWAALVAYDDTGVGRAGVLAQQGARGTTNPPAGTIGFPTSVDAYAGTPTVQIIDSLGKSSFVQGKTKDKGFPGTFFLGNFAQITPNVTIALPSGGYNSFPGTWIPYGVSADPSLISLQTVYTCPNTGIYAAWFNISASIPSGYYFVAALTANGSSSPPFVGGYFQNFAGSTQSSSSTGFLIWNLTAGTTLQPLYATNAPSGILLNGNPYSWFGVAQLL